MLFSSSRRRLSRVLATASSHVGAVSRVPPARRRAGGGVGGGAFPLQLSLDFGFGSPLSGVVGSDITAEDVEFILGEDEDDSNNESSNDSDVLFDGMLKNHIFSRVHVGSVGLSVRHTFTFSNNFYFFMSV